MPSEDDPYKRKHEKPSNKLTHILQWINWMAFLLRSVFHWHVQQSPQLDLILRHMLTFAPFHPISSTSILYFDPVCDYASFRHVFLLFFLRISIISMLWCRPCSTLFHGRKNILWKVKITKLFTVHFLFFLPLQSKYSPQHFVLI
jgi:hypothetical protein